MINIWNVTFPNLLALIWCIIGAVDWPLVGPRFGYLFNLKMIVGLYVWYKGKQRFCCFWLFLILMPHNVIMIHFRLTYFMSQIVLYFLHSTSVLSFYMDVVLTLSNRSILPMSFWLTVIRATMRWPHCRKQRKVLLYNRLAKYLWPLLLTWFNFNPRMDM